jgi:hypothetical protein
MALESCEDSQNTEAEGMIVELHTPGRHIPLCQSLKLYTNSGASFDPRWPGEVVTCSLRVPEWQALADECGLNEEASEIIRGLVKGFTQGIPDHTLGTRRWFTPDNHQSALLVAEKVRNTLAKEKREGHIFDPFTHEEVYQKMGFFWLSPMGSVINGDGLFRVINDLSYPQGKKETPSVNIFVNKDKFKTSWDDFKILAAVFQDGKG